MSGGEKGEEGIGSAAAGGKRDSTLRKKTEPAHRKGDSPKMRRLSVRAAEQKRGDTPQEERVPRIAEERTAVRAAGRRGEAVCGRQTESGASAGCAEAPDMLCYAWFEI